MRRGDEGVTTGSRRRSAVALALLAAMLLAGCKNLLVNEEIVVMESNYITWRHPATDESDAAVRKRAGEICAGRKQNAYRTENVCSLTQCRTTYQCMSAADAAAIGY